MMWYIPLRLVVYLGEAGGGGGGGGGVPVIVNLRMSRFGEDSFSVVG